MIPFPSIEQFRNVIKEVNYKNPLQKPKLKFRGSVKLHGSNAGICYYPDKGYEYQSRSRVLTPDSDNCGFMALMTSNQEKVDRLFTKIRETYIIPEQAEIQVYGEICGSNVQKGVALTGLPKMFVVFAIKSGDIWQDIDKLSGFEIPEVPIYVISSFPQFDIEIDFAKTYEAQPELIKLVEQVEKECPVGKHFGVSGIGEGIVWVSKDPEYNSSRFFFKTKGEKHSESKVRTLVEVDVEALRSRDEFVDRVCTEERMNHALDKLTTEMQKPMDVTSMGDFLRLFVSDVVKEEADTAEASGLVVKDLGKPLSNKARQWFLKKLDETVIGGTS